jgi:hypothetical protein
MSGGIAYSFAIKENRAPVAQAFDVLLTAFDHQGSRFARPQTDKGGAVRYTFVWTGRLLCHKVIVAERFDVKFGSQRAQTRRLPLRR